MSHDVGARVGDVAGKIRSFPPGFAWGAATAAYQIEGAVAEEGRGPSIWDTFSHTPGATLHGDNGDIACDHYHRWETDLDLVDELGLSAYRLSLSWSRLQPSGRGSLNRPAVDHYRAELGRLREMGVRAFVTLYHWDLPQPLEDRGGWPSRETAMRFADYVAEVAAELGDLADDWITVNEPWCSSFLGYGSGKHAPGRRDLSASIAAGHHLNLASGSAVQAFRAERPRARLGATHIVTDLVPGSDGAADLAAMRRLDASSNRFFLDPVLVGEYPSEVHELYDVHGLADHVLEGDEAIISTPVDFLGVNHYHQDLVFDDPSVPVVRARTVAAEPAITSLGWSFRPESLTKVLQRVAALAPELPLYVTENGASFNDYVNPDGGVDDPERVQYLDGYLSAAAEAIDAGVRLEGYFAWSLLDNFEWGEGYRPRFGLIFVEYGTQARIPKESAGWYRDVIALHARTVGRDLPHAEPADASAVLRPERSERRAVSPK